MFVEPLDFGVPPYSIPKLSQEESFLDYVNNMEKELLVKVLGRNLQEAFYTGLEIVGPVEQRWIDLKEGKEYTYNGKTYKWVGMNKIFVPYIFAMWLRDTFDNYTGSGIAIPKIENAEWMSPNQRIVRSYNEAARLIGNQCEYVDTLYAFLYQSGDVYTDSLGSGYSSIQVYLSDVFCDPGRMNLFDI